MARPNMIALAAALISFVGTAQARTLEVGAGKEFKQPSEAIKAARPGDVVSIGAGEYFDCAFVQVERITIQGVGDPAQVVLTDKSCGGKGLLVISGNGVTVRNLTLARSRVPDGNGAGIRNEAPDLTIDRVRFVNNQNGILSTPAQPGTVLITNSVFDRNGGCANGSGCAHGIYISSGKLTRIEGTSFSGTKQGHHIKSRGARLEVLNSRIEDGPTGTASYLIEAANGGDVLISGNTMQKGPEAENHTAAISIGAEGVTQRTRDIVVERNNFRNDGAWSTAFVYNLSAADAVVRGNTIAGQVRPLVGDGAVTR